MMAPCWMAGLGASRRAEAGGTKADQRRSSRFDLLSWAALLAAIVVTASGEYQLGVHAGFGSWIAAGIPAALDVYALRAMRVRRDVMAVVFAMIAVNGLSHLVSTGLLRVNVPLVVAVSAIAPLVFWRVHLLASATTVVTGGEVCAADDVTGDDDVASVPERPSDAPTTPVSYTNAVDLAIRPLYDGGLRPTTKQMTAAMTNAGLEPKESTARAARIRIEACEPHLKDRPSALTG
ncbi:hypothetical protein [Streptomyces sp. NPDC059009]|uniref:hypothetical protein n=1 Tax=Streptomyces sp. NPDC059009 TaxID=3346694 RepID=UPI0036A46BD9